MKDTVPVREALQYVQQAEGCQPGWRQKVDSLLDLLLPRRCIICGLPAPAPGLCHGCRDGLPFCHHACPVCGLPLGTESAVACGACQRQPPPWDEACSATWYQFPVSQLVSRYKYRRNLAAGGVLAELLADRLVHSHRPAPDLVVPVPLHGWRLFLRGFNQAYDLARLLSRRLGLTLSENDLRRCRHTRPQAGLDARERGHNLDQAFHWHGPALRGQHLALVDDVMTTGSTMQACCTVLRHAGAGRLSVWTVARAIGPN